MQYGVWYGLASWFVVLKLPGVEPVASVNWLFVVPLLAWPALPQIGMGTVRWMSRLRKPPSNS